MRFERTGVVPKHSQEYKHLREWYNNLKDEQKQRKAEQNDLDMSIAKRQNREMARVFGGRTFGNNNVGILGHPTIWARGWTATKDHPEAPWPGPQEFREEGDERHTSNYGRFLPIPRVPGNRTVAYKQKPWTPVESFDRIMHVPKVCGMVNTKMFGFYEIEVDSNGVPYDDHDLPGDEYIIKQDNVFRGDERTSATARGPTLLATDPIRPATHDFADFVLDSMSAAPNRKYKGSKIKATAAPFYPRNFAAPNSEGLNRDQATNMDIKARKDEMSKKRFEVPAPNSDKSFQSRYQQTQPDARSTVRPQRAKTTLREQLRVNTNWNDLQRDLSTGTEPAPASHTEPDYGVNFAELDQIYAFSPAAETISPVSDSQGSAGYQNKTTFFASSPTEKKSAGPALGSRSRACSTTSTVLDIEDDEDGGVKLE